MAIAESADHNFDDPLDDLPLDSETEAEIDAAFECAKLAPASPDIVEAVYHPGPKHAYLMLRLSTGRRLLIPREVIWALKNASDEQALNVVILNPANAVWWPQVDEGLHLSEFLEDLRHTEHSRAA